MWHNNLSCKQIWLWLSLATLVGCQTHHGEEKLNNYLTRLSRALQTEIPAASTTVKPSYPSRRERNSAAIIPDSNISMIDFLKLDRCQLGKVVAEKNSSLGKVAQDSQRLFNLLDFLAHAPRCIKYLENTKQYTLVKKLKNALEVKKQHLNKSLWLAILGSVEYEAFWQLPHKLKDYPNNTNIETVLTLKTLHNFINSINSGNYLLNEAEKQKVEITLSKLRTQEGGYLIKSILLLQEKINQANTMLQNAINKPFCKASHYKQQITIVQNVVNLFFIQDVQIWAAQVNQHLYAIEISIEKLEESLNNNDANSFKQWQTIRNKLFKNISSDIIQHTKLIQILYKQCDIKLNS